MKGTSYFGVSFKLLTVFSLWLDCTSSLDNGMALTPPMGWMAWERFRCNVDCDTFPDTCISEKLFMDMADRMAEDGFQEAGYEYISIDDCWMEKTRDSQGRLQPDKKRFPSGMKALADYIHSKKLKLGIYADYGTHTCAGYPGSIDNMMLDAETFANWTVDYLKFDGCYSDPKTMATGYPEMTKALNATKRAIVFSCSWPAYLNPKPDYQIVAKYCNLWRNYNDIQDSWDSVLTIIDYYAENQDALAKAAGPGNWNDPDELIIGDFSLSFEQSKSQFAIWAIMASPLIMSNDLRKLAPEFKEILQNKDVIAVNQDKLGIQGKRVYKSTSHYEIWCKPLADTSVAVVLFSKRTDMPIQISFSFKTVGFPASSARIKDLFASKDLGVFKDSFKGLVNPSGVLMLKLTDN
ncbi:alpha-N-acetylgalactosaminidase-like [Dendronephthya gigantea]|uniref:alpha-N-acetylgalactosaminidase-like n=1 Tax=Dendronephthya gigantea TaxID=151771 RepID=UPI00106BF991|nr:alpha-N-acetylgalactosaminidase-like [Dendronephthya gigantea]